MTVIQLKQGEILVHKGEPAKELYIVLRGSVQLRTEYNEIAFGTGSVIGLMSGKSNSFFCDYVALEETLIAVYKYESPDDLFAIFKEQPKYSYAFLRAVIAQCKTIYEKYTDLERTVKSICDFVNKHMAEYELECSQESFEQKDVAVAELEQVYLPEPIRDWEMRYIKELIEQNEKAMRYYYSDNQALCIGEITMISDLNSQLMSNMDAFREYLIRAEETLICEDEDLVELWFDLAVKLALAGKDTSKLQTKIVEVQNFLNRIGLFTQEDIKMRINDYTTTDFQNYVQTHNVAKEEDSDLGEVAEVMSREDILKTDFATYIMKYAGFGQEEIARCKELLRAYAIVAVAQDNANSAYQKVRKEMTNMFYDIYEKAFLRASKARSISLVMELFFQFGVLDLQLAGVDYLDELLEAIDTIRKQQEAQKKRIAEGETFAHVYTIFQWLGMVYHGDREPCKNEFDVDYAGYLLEQRKANRITRAEENELKKDQLKKVQFEIRNMFMTNNRVTYGRITTFCPVLHKKDFVRTVRQMLLTVERVNEAIDGIRCLDYSAFYREVHFMAPEHGINRIEIMKEVLPEVILMPNIGTKAMMWQETSGVKRDTPARFIFPVMATGDLQQMMLETVGRYRWEICRKILGVRWNDIREKSLTSEFYDYVQFYRKNRELTQQAKEKVKADLLHAKNNYREVFVADYVDWMKYEAQGSYRLNKVSRRILSGYIPFPEATRRKLADNPMFKELFSKRELLIGRKREKEKVLFERYKAAGGVMTAELVAHMEFYSK